MQIVKTALLVIMSLVLVGMLTGVVALLVLIRADLKELNTSFSNVEAVMEQMQPPSNGVNGEMNGQPGEHPGEGMEHMPFDEPGQFEPIDGEEFEPTGATGTSGTNGGEFGTQPDQGTPENAPLGEDGELLPPLDGEAGAQGEGSPGVQSGAEASGNSNNPGDPRNHAVHITGSTSPLQFRDIAEPQFDPGSVPELVVLTTASAAGSVGDVLVYVPGFYAGLGPDAEGMRLERSLDNGLTWEEDPEPIYITGKPDEVKGVVDPSVVQLEDGRLRMYFYGSTTTQGDPAKVPGDHTMYAAISEDGYNFEFEQAVFATNNITDPEVIQFNDTWFMYLSRGQSTVITTSDDGLSFTDTNEVWEGGGIPGALVYENKVYLYGCSGADIYVQSSSDGVNFDDDGELALSADTGNSNCDPAPAVLDDGSIMMVYKKA